MAAAECHGMSWYDDNAQILVVLNGPYTYRKWLLRTPVDREYVEQGLDVQRCISHLDYFLLLFPSSQLNLMQCLMNEEIERVGAAKQIEYKNVTKRGGFEVYWGACFVYQV